MLGFFNKDKQTKRAAAMSDADLEKGVTRYNNLLAKHSDVSTFLAFSTIMGTGISALVMVLLLGVAVNAVAVPMLACGAAIFFGGGYSWKGIQTQAVHKRNVLEDEIGVRQQRAEENARTRQLAAEAEAAARAQKAMEDFHSALNAGLPLEQSISVKKSPLKLKPHAPPLPQSEFARLTMRIFGPKL